MKSVKFNSVYKCAPDGKIVQKFAKGDEAEFEDVLAEAAVKSGAADFVEEEAPKSKRKAKKPAEDKSKDSDEDK